VSGANRAERWSSAYALSILATYVALFVVFFRRVGRMDHDQFLVFHELQYWNASLFGSSRQWTPVMCGGLSTAADPQVPFASLGMALATVLGPFYGLRLATAAWFAVGWVGAFLYAGLGSRERVTRALAASLFIGNGFFVMRLQHGHLDLIPFLSLPLVLFILHRRRILGERLGGGLVGAMVLSLLLGATIALVLDGAPVAILHWLLWIGVYALALAVVERAPGGVGTLAGAGAVAAVLEAGYLWPVLAAQQEFPRSTPDAFTSPLSLLWFLVVPGGGKVVPAPALGHELSLWVGPVLLWVIVRHARVFWQALPRELREPLAVTAVVSFVLGMGSLGVLGWPWILSPFDLLRRLPGFRSMGVTARYWGFLALPLAMAGASGVTRLVRERGASRAVRGLLVLAMLLQVGFQAGAVASGLRGSRTYAPAPLPPTGRPMEIEFARSGGLPQGATITPTRGVIDCYNNGDFLRPPMVPGRLLVQQVWLDDRPFHPTAFKGSFLSWSHIVVEPGASLPPGRWRVVLNQAHHRHWRSADAMVQPTPEGNLAIEWVSERGPAGPIHLVFEDPVSTLGSRVSRIAWASLFLGVPLAALWRRPRRGTPA
jgi:hypothetical protein